mgnify:CR=1 FL=1
MNITLGEIFAEISAFLGDIPAKVKALFSPGTGGDIALYDWLGSAMLAIEQGRWEDITLMQAIVWIVLLWLSFKVISSPFKSKG